MPQSEYKKIIQSLNYIAEKNGGEVNYMKALKLLYFSDRLHLRKYGRLITNDQLVAMEYGMLGSLARDIAIQNERLPHVIYEYTKDKLIRDIGQEKYTIKANSKEVDELSETDLECLDLIFDSLGGEKEFELAKLTHKLPEWERHAYELKTKEKGVVKVSLDDLFRNSEDELLSKVYSQSEEELSLIQDIFTESYEQQSVIDA